ncbi:MAG: DNA polymerase IV [Clostridia bacterium]|nr:DNA polymerase IV [Clostridia bacterium]
MKERVVLHSDLNNFFASVETALDPSLKGKPVAVCGDPKERRGVVLAKNEEAKKYGVKTAETVYSALKKCPNLVCVPTHFAEYVKYSEKVREIYARYTDQIEVCSIDECALDVTASTRLFGSGEEIAHKIRTAVKEELGVTVSIGVSFNKIFAKLASEMRKPDAVTVIPKQGFEKIVYPLPVEDLLSIGGKTKDLLNKHGIYKIGDLANANEADMIRWMGKRGRQVWLYARGEDNAPVLFSNEKDDVKSIGNSTTLVHDISSREEIKRWFFVIAESVVARLRKSGVGKASTVHIVVRKPDLSFYSYQEKVRPTALCSEVAQAAFELYCKHFPEGTSVRLLGITVSGFDKQIEQLSLDGLAGEKSYEKKEKVESVVSKLREKYGYASVQRGVILEDGDLNGLDLRKHSQTPDKED